MAIPQVTLTGTLKDISGVANAGKLTFTLCNFGDTPPVVTGTAIVADVVITVQAEDDGTFSATLWGNDQLEPNTTYYQVAVNGADGSTVMVAAYLLNSGTYDLSNLIPLDTSKGIPINPADVEWNNVSNKPTTFTPSAHNHLVANITDFPTTWAWSALSGVPSTFTPSAHTHVVDSITDFPTTWDWLHLTNKPSTFAPSAHNHPFTQITGITGTPDGTKFLRDDGTWTTISATVAGDWNTLLNKPDLSVYALNGANTDITSLKVGDGTAAAPTYSFGSQTGTGMYRPAANTLGWAINGTDYLRLFTTSLVLPYSSSLSWTAGGVGGTADTNFSRISAGVVGIGNGTQGNTTGTLKAAAVTLKDGSGNNSFLTTANTASVYGDLHVYPNAGVGGPSVSIHTDNTWAGWARSLLRIADGSNNEFMSIGGYGGPGTAFTYMWFGTSYNGANTMTFTPSTGVLKVASVVSPSFVVGSGGAQLTPNGAMIAVRNNGNTGDAAISASDMLSSGTVKFWGTSSFDVGISRGGANVLNIGNGTAGDKTGSIQGNNAWFNNLYFQNSSVIEWGSDTGISRTAAKTVAIGNGTQGDASGTIKAYQTDIQGKVMIGAGIQIASSKPLMWSATDANTGGVDTGLSRTAAGTVAIGNGTAGNGSGNLVTASVSLSTGINVSSNTQTSQGSFTFADDTYYHYPYINFNRARGTVSVPTTTVANDIVGAINYYGYNGSGYEGVGGFGAVVSGLSGGNHPIGKLFFSVNDGTTAGSNFTAFETTATQTTLYTHLKLGTDNTYDIGASGANRPKTGYFGTGVHSAGYVYADSFLGAGTAAPVKWWGTSSYDTGLSRSAAGTVAVGNGTAGDVSGTLRTTIAVLGTASGTVLGNNVTTTGYTSIGTNPATSGGLRMANAQQIYWRNAANSADLLGLNVDGSNNLYLGDSSLTGASSIRGSNIYLASGNDVNIWPTSGKFVNLAYHSNFQTLTATSGANYNSPMVQFIGKYWDGAAGQSDYWQVQNVIGTGSNPTATLTFAHSGTSGVASVSFPGTVSAGGNLTAGSAQYVQWGNRATMSSPADGKVLLSNWAVNDFTMLQFGGTTSSFPALKRNGQQLDFKYADDSGYAGFGCSVIQAYGGRIDMAGATGKPWIRFYDNVSAYDTSITRTGVATISIGNGTQSDASGTLKAATVDVSTGFKVNGASLDFHDLAGTATTSQLPTFAGSTAGIVPASAGGTTNFLRADGTWAAPPAGGGGTPGGSDTQVQFNDGGAFGGNAGLIFNKTTGLLTSTLTQVGAGTATAPSLAVGAADQGIYAGGTTSGSYIYIGTGGKKYFGIGPNTFALYDASGNITMKQNSVAGRLDVTVGVAMSGGATVGTVDTGVTRVSAGVVGIGNGTGANTSGTLKAAAIVTTEVDNGTPTTTQTINWTTGNSQKVTLGGNITFTFTNPVAPCSLFLTVVQDGTGSRTVTWPASVKWPNDTAPTLSTGANKVDVVALYWNGTVYRAMATTGFSA